MSKSILFGMKKEENARKKQMGEADKRKCSVHRACEMEGLVVSNRVVQRMQLSISSPRSVV